MRNKRIVNNTVIIKKGTDACWMGMFVFLIVMGLHTLPLYSADIYVTPNTSAPVGNGSQSSPYNSISLGLNNAQPGDTVRLMEGVYYTFINFPRGGTEGQPIRLTTNEWYKASQLGDSYWLYVVWDPLANPDPEPMRIQNPVKYLDHAKREVVAARYYDIPAEAVVTAATKGA